MFAKALYSCFCCVSIACCATAQALPPLGLTLVGPAGINSDYGMETKIEVFNDTTYISNSAGVWIIDELGQSSLVEIGNPTLGVLGNVTRVIEGPGNELYVAAGFRGSDSVSRPALFSLAQPTTPLVTWNQGFAGGVRTNLEVLGTSTAPSGFEGASRFLLDGSVERFEYPPDSGGNSNSTAIALATPGGYGVGYASIPGTIVMVAPAVWSPSGNFEWLAPQLGAIFVTSIRDRHDDTGPNIGWDGGVQYGLEAPFRVERIDGSWIGGLSAIVSQGDFVVLTDLLGSNQIFGYYRGISPVNLEAAVPLLEVFPQLSSLPIDAIRDITAIDGFLYIALESDGQLYLFGARDPSVIPEPAAAVMALLCGAMWFRRRFHN